MEGVVLDKPHLLGFAYRVRSLHTSHQAQYNVD